MDFRAGQDWRVREDAKAICLLQFTAPFTGGTSVIVPAGEILIVESDPLPHARGVGFRPKRYAELMKSVVDAKDLANSKFAGYSLVIKFEEVARCCMIESGAR